MRIVTLLPAATEIVAALGLVDSIVGVSHECDYPPKVNAKPRVTHCEIYGKGLPSAEIDEWVSRKLAERGTIYTLEEALLRELQPDVIVTQQLCDVCAIDYASVMSVARALPRRPAVVSLSPTCLADIFDDIRRVAEATGVAASGAALVAWLQGRIYAVKQRTSRNGSRPRCLIMEWVDPPFCAGHWNPELVQLAGGIAVLGKAKAPSTKVDWAEIGAAQPEVVILACCGFDVERATADLKLLENNSFWQALPAVRNGRVYVVDGSAYFSRPGPRIVDSLEIVSDVLHPAAHGGHAACRSGAVMHLAIS